MEVGRPQLWNALVSGIMSGRKQEGQAHSVWPRPVAHTNLQSGPTPLTSRRTQPPLPQGKCSSPPLQASDEAKHGRVQGVHTLARKASEPISASVLWAKAVGVLLVWGQETEPLFLKGLTSLVWKSVSSIVPFRGSCLEGGSSGKPVCLPTSTVLTCTMLGGAPGEGPPAKAAAGWRVSTACLMVLCISPPGGAAQSASLQADLAGASSTLRGHPWSSRMTTQKVRPVTSTRRSRPRQSRHGKSKVTQAGTQPALVCLSPALGNGKLRDSLTGKSTVSQGFVACTLCPASD